MESIVLLSRGIRHAKLFGEIARSLAREFEVHVVIPGFYPFCSYEREAKYFPSIANVFLYNLSNEIETNWKSVQQPNFDINSKVSDIERELSIGLFHSASNYLLYRRFSKDYFKSWHGLYDTKEEIQKEFLGAYEFFTKLYTKIKPTLVFCEMPDLVSHRVATALALKRGIFETHINLIGAMGMNGFFLASGTNNKNALLEFYYQNPNTTEDPASPLIGELASQDNPYIGKLRKASGSYLKRLSTARLSDLKPRRLPILVRREVSRLKNLVWLEKHFKKELPKEPFILFMLHHQPEATTMLCAPQFVEQNQIAEQLAIHAPSGYKIVIKENPRTFGLRGSEYFGSLSELANVHLLHPSFDNARALRECAGMVVISGTAGLEGIFLKKKVAALAPNYYSFYPGVKKIKTPEEIFKFLNDEEWNPVELQSELTTFQNAFTKSYVPMGKPTNGTPWPEPKEGGETFASGIRRFISAVKTHGLKPEMFGVEA